MAYTKQQAQIEIAHLVETFQAGEAHLRPDAEAQIENNYIRPLFRCLNRNTQNAGVAGPGYESVASEGQAAAASDGLYDSLMKTEHR